MKYFHPLMIAAVLWLVPATLLAQTKQPFTPPPVAGSDSDLLGAEDILEIQVGNHSDLDQTAIVAQDGKVTLRELGQFMAAGKTRAALQNEIQVQADKTLNNAPVYLNMKERHLQRFTIDGGVTAPGVYPLTPGMKVLDAISAAHGLPLKPTRYTLKLIRKDKSQALSLPKIYSEPEGSVNMTLMPNDKLVFNEIELVRHKVTVLGQVVRPSTYEIDGDTTILTLLGQAGGISPAAALTKVTVNRGGTTIPLNLRPVLVKGNVDESILNFRFEDGDVLSVPGVETKFQVLGQVNRPASYVYPEQANITVLDALNTAGGPTALANLKNATIHRTVDGKTSDIKVDFESLQKKGLASANVLIQPDDILVVPQKGRHAPGLNEILAPLSILNLLGFRLFP